MATIAYSALLILQRQGRLINGTIYYTDNGVFKATSVNQIVYYTTETINIHIANESNPHSVTKSQVGLSEAENTSDLNKVVSTLTRAAVDAVQADLDAHEANVSNPHAVTKLQVGLSNVENTALSTWAGTANITTLGTVSTGVWNGTVIGSAYGGTGVNNSGRALTIGSFSGSITFAGAGKTLTVADNASVSGTQSGTNSGDQNLFSKISVSGQTDVSPNSATTALTVIAGSNVTITTDNTAKSFTINAASGGVTDGDKGDITVSGSGATWTIDNSTITLAKMADMATASVIYRKTAGTGAPEVNTITTLKTDMSLANVENTALSTWVGSTNITTLGTISTGVFAQTALVVRGGTTKTLTLKPNETFTADRTLNVKVNDVDRTIDLSGNLTVSSAATISGTNTGDQTTVSGNAGTVTVADAGGDTTTWVLLGTSQTGSLAPATDAGLTYNATTDALTATTFIGALSGNAATSSSTTGNAATVTGFNPTTGKILSLSKTMTLTAADDTGSYTFPTGTKTLLATDGSAASLTSFPTLNQDTTGASAKVSVAGQTGLITFTGLASTSRIKTIRDAADTILELGGSYTPTGTWTSLTMVTPVLGTPTSGNLANCTFPTLNQNTSGTSSNVSGTPALPNGTTATTQSQADNSAKLSTTAYADTGLATKQATLVSATNIKTINGSSVLGSGDLVVTGSTPNLVPSLRVPTVDQSIADTGSLVLINYLSLTGTISATWLGDSALYILN